MLFNVTQILNTTVTFLLQFIAIFAGAYVKEYYNLTKKKHKIRIGKIIVASSTISFLLIGFSPMVLKQVSLGVMFTGCFLLGISSNKIMDFVLDGTVLKLFGKIFFKNISESVKEVINERESEEEKENKEVEKEEEVKEKEDSKEVDE